jgi:RHS repeat-associated protein
MHKNLSSALLANDTQGSILRSCSTGKVSSTAYTPYGDHWPMLTPSTSLGFTGQYREPTLSVYILGNGYRTYAPRLLRFMSPDNLSPFDKGGINAYAYCAADPINFRDPSGHTGSLIAKFEKFARIEIEIDHRPKPVASQRDLWERPGNTQNLELEPKTRSNTFHRDTFVVMPIGGADRFIAEHHVQELLSKAVELKQLTATLKTYKKDPNAYSRRISDLNTEISKRAKRNQTIVKYGASMYASARSPENQNIHIRGDY